MVVIPFNYFSVEKGIRICKICLSHLGILVYGEDINIIGNLVINARVPGLWNGRTDDKKFWDAAIEVNIFCGIGYKTRYRRDDPWGHKVIRILQYTTEEY